MAISPSAATPAGKFKSVMKFDVAVIMLTSQNEIPPHVIQDKAFKFMRHVCIAGTTLVKPLHLSDFFHFPPNDPHRSKFSDAAK